MEEENARESAEEGKTVADPEPKNPTLAQARSLAPWDDPITALPRDIGRTAPFTHPRLRNIPRDGDTEDLLNGLIAECHFLMREVALPTAVQVSDAITRSQFLNTAMSLAQTGAKVGRTIAKLRAAGSITEIRQRHISERVMTGPAPLRENGAET